MESIKKRGGGALHIYLIASSFHGFGDGQRHTSVFEKLCHNVVRGPAVEQLLDPR